MAGPLTTKLRLVRCPGCRVLLEESPNVLMYRCGGCSLVLQAKKFKKDTRDADLHIPDTNTGKKNEIEEDFEDREARSLSKKDRESRSSSKEDKEARSLTKEDKEARSLSTEEMPSSTGELPLEKSNGRDQKENTDGNMGEAGVTWHGSEDLSTEAREEAEVDQDKCSLKLKQNNGGDPNEYVQCNGKQSGGVYFPDEVAAPTEPNHHKIALSEVDEIRNCLEEENGGVNFPDEVASSTELYHLGSEDSSPVAGAHSEVDESRNCFDQNNERNQIGYGICNGKQAGGVNVSDGVVSSTELNNNEREESSPVAGAHSEGDENRNCFEHDNERNQIGYGVCNGKQTGGVNFSREVVPSTELNDNEIVESSPIVRAHSDTNETRACLEQNDGRNQSKFGDFTRDGARDTGISYENSSRTELPCHEIEETNPVIKTNRNSEENSKSSMAVEQSCKRQVTGFDRISFVDTLENAAVANYSSEFSVTHRDIPNFPTTSSYAYDGSVSSYDGNDDRVPDHYRHLFNRKVKKAGSPFAKAMDKRHEAMNKITSYQEMEHHACSCSPIRSEKMHYSTKGKWHQDELTEPIRLGPPVRGRTKFESGGYRSRVPFYSGGSQVAYETGSPFNYRREEFHSANKPEKNPEEEKRELLNMVFELQDQLNRTRISKGVAPEVEMCPRRCNHGKRWPHQNRTSRIPFSAEANMSTYQVDHSCFHCCPHDRMSSAPLPPHVFCNKNQYQAHQSPRYCNLYSSTPSSPPLCTSSEFSLQSYEANSDVHELKKYQRERNRFKRKIRPVAGGAPFIICYRCSELLQLPLDFLLSRRRFHKLRCSACSNTLKFSLEDGTRIFPYTEDCTLDAIAPPPSEVDDYGPSLGKSCSTEGERLSVGLPFQADKRDFCGRKMSSGSSFKPMGERTRGTISKEFENKKKNSVDMFAAARLSSKMSKAAKISSEIEESRQLSVSPLHRLMGYASASEVMDR